jgi:ribosomal-protein-alanine N-acetyltransferase
MLQLLDDKVLKTQRLLLEPLTPEHAANLFNVFEHKDIYKYIPGKPPLSVVELETKYEPLQSRLSPAGDELWLNWAVKLNSSGEYVGTVQATIYEEGPANLGYVFGSNYWGKGYAYEACSGLIEYLFNEYQLKKLKAEVHFENIASIKLLEKLGFKRLYAINNSDDLYYELEK